MAYLNPFNWSWPRYSSEASDLEPRIRSLQSVASDPEPPNYCPCSAAAMKDMRVALAALRKCELSKIMDLVVERVALYVKLRSIDDR